MDKRNYQGVADEALKDAFLSVEIARALGNEGFIRIDEVRGNLWVDDSGKPYHPERMNAHVQGAAIEYIRGKVPELKRRSQVVRRFRGGSSS